MIQKQLKNIIIKMHFDYIEALRNLNKTGNLNPLFAHGLCNYMYKKQNNYLGYICSYNFVVIEQVLIFLKICYKKQNTELFASGYWWPCPISFEDKKEIAECLQNRIYFLQWIIENEL